MNRTENIKANEECYQFGYEKDRTNEVTWSYLSIPVRESRTHERAWTMQTGRSIFDKNPNFHPRIIKQRNFGMSSIKYCSQNGQKHLTGQMRRVLEVHISSTLADGFLIAIISLSSYCCAVGGLVPGDVTSVRALLFG